MLIWFPATLGPRALGYWGGLGEACKKEFKACASQCESVSKIVLSQRMCFKAGHCELQPQKGPHLILGQKPSNTHFYLVSLQRILGPVGGAGGERCLQRRSRQWGEA